MKEYIDSFPIHHSEDSEQFLKMKMSVQRGVIEMLVPIDTPNRKQEIIKWIEANDSKFRSIFEKRVETEEDFLSRCDSEKDLVVEEIIEELHTI